MQQSFDSRAFIDRIGKRLVDQFDEARMATTPSLVGGAMEKPVRDQLEQILPRGIAVGSGCVIDATGHTSKQQDIVLYEKDICPEFSINNTPETTYYPCEGVFAVGEVKSRLDNQTLTDAFHKIESVKCLQRTDILHPIPIAETGRRFPIYRKYGSLHSDSILNSSERDKYDHRNQIFGFILAGNLRVKIETLRNTYLDLTRLAGDPFAPNLLAVLTGEQLIWVNNKSPRRVYQQQDGKHILTQFHDTWDSAPAAQNATHLAIQQSDGPFRNLIDWIYNAYRVGETSETASFQNYIRGNNAASQISYLQK